MAVQWPGARSLRAVPPSSAALPRGHRTLSPTGLECAGSIGRPVSLFCASCSSRSEVQSLRRPGELLALLAQEEAQGSAGAGEGEVVVEEADEDEGDRALRQTVADLEEPDGVEGEPDRGAGDEEDSLQDLAEDEENQQRTEGLEDATHHADEDRLVVQEGESDADLENHAVGAQRVEARARGLRGGRRLLRDGLQRALGDRLRHGGGELRGGGRALGLRRAQGDGGLLGRGPRGGAEGAEGPQSRLRVPELACHGSRRRRLPCRRRREEAAGREPERPTGDRRHVVRAWGRRAA
mmetsp:Transcript_66338/g.173931  ORF Transcript_66338/g.173931 Transcript_66338/m.173931 type:complete len:295 (+) Transcript_66338:148-1032(+)